MSSIRISPKHGVNPIVTKCPCCGKDTGVALLGKIKDDAEAPINIYDQEPCDSCKKEFDDYKTKGFVLFIIRDEYEKYAHTKSPWLFFYRVSVITHEAKEKIFKDFDTSKGAAFLPLSFAKEIGVIREEEKETK